MSLKSNIIRLQIVIALNLVTMKNDILYSFRRCPYAIRARWALLYCKKQVQVREVSLKNKPKELIEVSNKGTVPVLITQEGQIIEAMILDTIYL